MLEQNGCSPSPWRVLLWNGGSLWIGRGGGGGQPHAHHAIQVSVALTGQVRLRGGPQGAWADVHGAVVLPHQRHQFDSAGQSAANIFVEPETLQGRALLKRYAGASISPLAQDTLAPLVAPLHAAFAQGAGHEALVAHSQRVVEGLVGQAAGALSVDPRVTRAIAHIRARLGTPVTLGEAAAVAHLSPSRFRHLFVAQTGSSFRAYLLWARVEAAVGAAMAGHNWTQAAHAWGFADSAHLSRTCRRMFGIAPSMLVRH